MYAEAHVEIEEARTAEARLAQAKRDLAAIADTLDGVGEVLAKAKR